MRAGVDLLRLNTVSRRAVPPPLRAAGSSARWTSRGQRHAARFLPCGHHAGLGALVIKRIELQMDASGEVTKALDFPAFACAMRGMAIPSATAHCGLLLYPFSPSRAASELVPTGASPAPERRLSTGPHHGSNEFAACALCPVLSLLIPSPGVNRWNARASHVTCLLPSSEEGWTRALPSFLYP